MIKKIFISLGVILLLIVVIYDYSPEGRVYDCSLAEISADIPIQIKEECRKLRREMEQEFKFQKKPISA